MSRNKREGKYAGYSKDFNKQVRTTAFAVIPDSTTADVLARIQYARANFKYFKHFFKD